MGVGEGVRTVFVNIHKNTYLICVSRKGNRNFNFKRSIAMTLSKTLSEENIFIP